MYSTSTINIKVYAAEKLKNSLNELSTNNTIYFAYGKADQWPNEPIPDVANNCVATSYDFWKNMIAAKRVLESDVRHVIPRNNWTANTVYTAYDHLDSTLYNPDVRFHVINSEYNVYKCLSNNYDTPSLYEPLTVSTNNTIQTADGYIWKFMYNVNEYERQRYTTSSFIPVKTITSDNGSRQWDVQQAAVDGAIHSILITNTGSNYTNSSSLIVTITGDGEGATATATINTSTNTINAVYITSIGQKYTQADVSISGGGGSGAAARAIISPKGGHGKDPLSELGGNYLIFNPRLINDEDGLLTATNDFRQVALISNPYIWRSNTEISANSIVTQTIDITLTGTSVDYVQDEWVYQGRSLAQATFKGKVMSWDTDIGLLKLTNVYGDPGTEGLIGSNSYASRFVSSVKYPDLEPYTGSFLYINNITPITRSLSQTEDFKIIIKF